MLVVLLGAATLVVLPPSLNPIEKVAPTKRADAFQLPTTPPTISAGAGTLTMPGSALTAKVSSTGLTSVTGATTLGSRGYVAGDYSQGLASSTPAVAVLVDPVNSCASTGLCSGQGTVTVTFSQPVDNSGGAGTYDLDDALRFGGGITVDGATVANTTPGSITTNPAWDGLAATRVVTGQAIAAGAGHRYRVTVHVEVPTSVTSESRDCTLTTTETGTGFLNAAVLSSNDVESHDEACGSTPPPPPTTSTSTTSIPTTTSAPSVTPPKPQTPPTRPLLSLPRTGAELARLAGLAAVLLVAGALVLGARRRRYRH